MKFKHVIVLIFVAQCAALAQSDSVDITFMYLPSGSPALVHLPGEFNNWANNSGGSISPDPRWTMIKRADQVWEKTVRLKIGGGTGPGGAYQYKFNVNGTSNGWIADPLNPRTFGAYGNSVVAVGKPTIYPLLPKSGGVESVDTPRISAGIFPSIGRSIDAARTAILVDGITAVNKGTYDAATSTFSIVLQPLGDGEHTVLLRAFDDAGNSTHDSTRITVKAAPLQWLTRNNPRVYDSTQLLRGFAADARVTDIRIVRNSRDTIAVTMQGQQFSAPATLEEGDNTFTAFGMLNQQPILSETITLRRIVDHSPRPVMTVTPGGASFFLSAVQSSDPDGDIVKFRWISEDSLNPEPLGLDREGPTTGVLYPRMPGEYFIRLEATDAEGNTGFVRHYMSLVDGEWLSGVDDNPRWLREAIVYEIFVPAFPPSGTLRSVIDRLPEMRDLGVNTLWLMPIMDNRGTVNEFNGGYDIIDFFAVDESLGTLADFRELADSCHAHGMRVILDITPNHVSSEHPWVNDIRTWKDHSIYRGFIEQRVLGNARDLGQSVVTENGYPLYARYSNWALPNLNLSNRATREAMLDVYRFWTREMRADGFRMDVYWGPQNRYGQAVWWRPFREEIKRIKPEILVLGETDGTGTGSEVNYADGGGAMDAGYDWNWYGQAKSTIANGDVAGLMNRTRNYSPNQRYNHYTGPNSLYLRFLENHDEDRIAQLYSSNIERSKPGAAVMLTAPGMPMIYAGQEIGWKGRRDRINFSQPPSPPLRAYYKKLARLRSVFPALRSNDIVQLVTTASATMSYLRPYPDQNIIVTAGFGSGANIVRLNIDEASLSLTRPLDQAKLYYLNDMLNDTAFAVTKSTLSSVEFGLAAWQSRVLLLADTALFPVATGIGETPSTPESVELLQAFPHPLHVSSRSDATIRYTLPAARSGHSVRVTFVDALGRILAAIDAGPRDAGTHAITLPAAACTAPGLIHCRLEVRNPGDGSTEVRHSALMLLP